MGIARHSYEVTVYEPDHGNVDEQGLTKLRLLSGAWTRAEGIHLDRARKAARKMVEATGRIIRTLNVTKQTRTRANGPTTGDIVIVVHGPERSIKPKTMLESRLKRGLPKEIAK